MKKNNDFLKSIAVIMAISVLFTSCASTTMIQSNAVGADVFLNGELAGKTPYKHRDMKIVGSTTEVKIEKEGFETLQTSFSRDEKADVGAIIAGVFFLFPFLWTMKYKPVHNYDMKITNDVKQAVSETETQSNLSNEN